MSLTLKPLYAHVNAFELKCFLNSLILFHNRFKVGHVKGGYSLQLALVVFITYHQLLHHQKLTLAVSSFTNSYTNNLQLLSCTNVRCVIA